MSGVTTRLATLDPPGSALDELLGVLRLAAESANGTSTVSRSGCLPALPGEPDGFTLVELTTSSGQLDDHYKFILAAGAALTDYGVTFAWQHAGEDWSYSECPGCVGRGTGKRCCMCGGQIPVALRRAKGAPEEYDRACADCRTGRRHAHAQ